MVNSIQCSEVSLQLAPTSHLQLGFARLQLQALKLHGQSHVPCDLELALEKRLWIREGEKRHPDNSESEERFNLCWRELHAAGFKSYRERLTQPRESGATATTAYEMAGNCMAHRHRVGRVTEMNVSGRWCKKKEKWKGKSDQEVIIWALRVSRNSYNIGSVLRGKAFSMWVCDRNGRTEMVKYAGALKHVMQKANLSKFLNDGG